MYLVVGTNNWTGVIICIMTVICAYMVPTECLTKNFHVKKLENWDSSVRDDSVIDNAIR